MEESYMTVWNKRISLLLSAFIGIIIISTHTVLAANSVTLYTPYTKISVAPGESIDYSIDVINNSDELQNVDLSVSGIPKLWNYTIKSGGLAISQLSILPKEKKSFTLKVEVPFQVNKGSYRFKVGAGELGSLPLVISISEKGTYETEFSSDQPNMEGHSASTFSFRSKLNNQTADVQLYALMADVQRGWNVTFKSGGRQISSVEIEANSNKEINIDINPPSQVEAGKYKIPITATTSNTTARLELEVVITGTYSMELTTPTGLLSTEITAGEEKKLELVVKNTGSSPLTDIQLSSSAPSNWSVQFNPKKIDRLQPGNSTQVYATIKADKKAIPGDYVTNLEARTPEVASKAVFRIAVKTPILWGWFGILVILGALGSVYYLFRKFGRR
jgi:uncharacterized membrane protein